jgi:hypothetical protein
MLIPKGVKPKRIKPKRTSDKHHLEYVASQPCCICGKLGVQVHHLLRADPKRSMSRKAGDEFTVPLCHHHHLGLHTCGDEGFYLDHHNVDGPGLAAKLWEQSHE